MYVCYVCKSRFGGTKQVKMLYVWYKISIYLHVPRYLG